MTKKELLAALSQFEAFQNVETEALEWLIDHSEYEVIEEGDTIITPNVPVEYMLIIVRGEFLVELVHGGELKELGTWGTGSVTGILPFSRMKESRAYGRALEEMHVLKCHKNCFPDLVCQSYQLTQNLVAVMSTRIREFTHSSVQTEKLLALGKLSAGLAHELNNPASAMVRSAQFLYKNIHSTPEKFKAVMTIRATDEQTDGVNEILFSKIESHNPDDELSLMERENYKDDLLDWLEDHNVDNAEDMAETFVDFRMTEEDLENIREIMNGQHLAPVLGWLESTLNNERLICEIIESADRISSLIKSIKSYSHMGRGEAKEWIDIHEGIVNTVIMLKHKIKESKVELVKNFDKTLPKIETNPGELNQVWTNLIDYAIDAMEEGGRLTIETARVRDSICVYITDTGKGIPPDQITRIFEPFYTTKSVGKGTGMGLDIVRRIVTNHKGSIDVDSDPGKTTFTVCIPILK